MDKKRDNLTDDTHKVVSKSNSFVYNYVSQTQAANLSQNMYNSTNFTSDLVNSYAWDTTTLVFIQKCSDDNDYSQQNSLNLGNFKVTGTMDDIRCNIYDMASNGYEWTTETSNNEKYPCILEGGYCYNDMNLASTRESFDLNDDYDATCFRTILYL